MEENKALGIESINRDVQDISKDILVSKEHLVNIYNLLGSICITGDAVDRVAFCRQIIRDLLGIENY